MRSDGGNAPILLNLKFHGMKKNYIFCILLIFVTAACHQNSKQHNMKSQTNSDSAVFRSGYAEVNGINMYYELHGDKGEYLVLIHGGGSTIGTTFGKILPLLADHYRVIAVELQAHGHTGDRDAPESFEQDADDVAALLNHLHIAKASFFGFSNGGSTAMQVAVRQPAIVDKLVIASAIYKRSGLPPGFFEGMEHATLDNMPKALQDAFLKINPDSSKLLNMFTKDRDRMLHFKDWKDEDMASIKSPTLIIAGDKDVVTPAHTLKMSGIIPGAQLLILPGTHGSFIGEVCATEEGSKMPETTVTIVKEFLDK